MAHHPDNESGASSAAKDSSEIEGSRAEQVEKKIKLITWNIDGLDPEDRIDRTKAVCFTIARHDPDIVFLQEVIVDTALYIIHHCKQYKMLLTNDMSYFTAMMLKKSTVDILSNTVEPFENSSMRRKLHKVKVKCAGVDLLLMNSHLESIKENSETRKRQFKVALEEMSKTGEGTVALFGGDTNLRDYEVTSVGGLPSGIVDLWQVFGSPENAKYTWDIKRNNNLDWPFPNTPRIRFDRLFMRQTTPQVSLETFKLIGDYWISIIERYPSDHFGIFCEFKVVESDEYQIEDALDSNENIN